MAEFLLVFIVTFVVILGVTAMLMLGQSPVYRPDIDKVQAMLTRLLEGQLPDHEWQFFLDMPIRHDPNLEDIRLKCLQIVEENALRPRNNVVRLREPGLIRIRHLLNQIEQKGTRSF